MSELSKDLLLNIVKQIGLGINFCRSYPKGHPGIEPIIAKALTLFKEIPSDRSEIAMCMIENIILFEGERFEPDRLPIVKSIGTVFGKLGVRSASFNVDLNTDDLKAFFYAMASTPADLQDYGDVAAILDAQGTERIKVNELEYGIVSAKGGKVKIDWEVFLKTLRASNILVSEEDTQQELVKFLSDVVGLKGGEPDELQAKMITNTLEKLCNFVTEKFGAENWGEYSLIFTRILATLSPNIKSRVAGIKTENKRLAELIRNILPTLSDETLLEVISSRALASEEGLPEPDVLEVLKKLTGPRLATLLPQLKDKLPKKALDEITLVLSQATKPVEAELQFDTASHEELEKELRKFFPALREPALDVRVKAIEDIMNFSEKLFSIKQLELIKLIVDRFDSYSDSEKDVTGFAKVLEALKDLYLKAKKAGFRDIYVSISNRMGKHLLRTGKELVDRKKIVINKIGEMQDLNYLTDLISVLWEPGTFNEAREALIKFSNEAVDPLIGVLKDAEDRSVRMKILDVLLKMGKIIVPSVVKLLSDEEWYVRRNGLYLLGELKETETVDEIGRLVTDENEQVQLEAVRALTRMEQEKTKPYLVEALKSKFYPVVLETVQHLPREEVKPVMPNLLKLLERRKRIPDKKEEEQRRNVILIIGRIGDDDIIENLLRVIKERSLIGSDLLLSTKEAAIEALQAIGSDKAIEALVQLAESSDAEIAALAQDGLDKIKKRT